jgi:hypothetical protein
MAKVTGPLMSLDARGTIGSAITYSFWRGINYVRSRVIPANPRSTDQVAIRDLITDASVAWKLGSTVGATTIDANYKTAYQAAAAGQQYSGFNLYIKDCVALNGGIAYDGSLELPTEPGDQTPGA